MKLAQIRKALVAGVSLASAAVAAGTLTGTPEVVANCVIAVVGTLLTWWVPNQPSTGSPRHELR
jgi:hypothetical protein